MVMALPVLEIRMLSRRILFCTVFPARLTVAVRLSPAAMTALPKSNVAMAVPPSFTAAIGFSMRMATGIRFTMRRETFPLSR